MKNETFFVGSSLSFSHPSRCCVFLQRCVNKCNSAEEHHGCLVKEHMKVVSYSTHLKSFSTSSIEQCAQYCAEISDCDSFDLYQKNECRLFRKGDIDRISSVSFTAGFCPKGVFYFF